MTGTITTHSILLNNNFTKVNAVGPSDVRDIQFESEAAAINWLKAARYEFYTMAYGGGAIWRCP